TRGKLLEVGHPRPLDPPVSFDRIRAAADFAGNLIRTGGNVGLVWKHGCSRTLQRHNKRSYETIVDVAHRLCLFHNCHCYSVSICFHEHAIVQRREIVVLDERELEVTEPHLRVSVSASKLAA